MKKSPLEEMDGRVGEWLAGVAARPSRRRAMREEILGHLMAGYEEEREAGASDDEAVGRVVGRLGEPGVFVAQLQGSVPWIERLVFGHWFGKELLMSRVGWSVAGVALVAVGSAVLLPALAQHRHTDVAWSGVLVPLVIGGVIDLAGLGAIVRAVVGRGRDAVV